MRAAEWNQVVFTDESRICVQYHDGRIRVWRHRGERMLNSCIMHRHIGPAPGLMVWGGIGYHSRTPLVRIAGTLNSQRYISNVLESVVLPYLQGLATAIFQQDNARPHVARIVQKLVVNPQIELLPSAARSPDLSPIENMWSMVAQRLTQITPPAATLDHLWQRGEAAWSAVPPEHIQSLFESMPMRVVAVNTESSEFVDNFREKNMGKDSIPNTSASGRCNNFHSKLLGGVHRIHRIQNSTLSPLAELNNLSCREEIAE
ncbi:transposable element Tc3 transposase [Trichonephila clavipes]|nr:transposable element Tc3 transposase [Trichonephila clavipes]